MAGISSEGRWVCNLHGFRTQHIPLWRCPPSSLSFLVPLLLRCGGRQPGLSWGVWAPGARVAELSLPHGQPPSGPDPTPTLKFMPCLTQTSGCLLWLFTVVNTVLNSVFSLSILTLPISAPWGKPLRICHCCLPNSTGCLWSPPPPGYHIPSDKMLFMELVSSHAPHLTQSHLMFTLE